MLQVTSRNILGWLELLLVIYPLTIEQKLKLRNFIKRRDVVRRQKEIDNIFGGEDEI